jgi:hypothetical protein
MALRGGIKMAFDKNNNFIGGLTGSFLGQKATQTRIRSMSSPEREKLKEELQAFNQNKQESEENIALDQEMLSRLDPKNL